MEKAQAAKPGDDRMRLYRVTWPGEPAAYVWTDGGWNAVVMVARTKGVRATVLEKVVAPEKVAELMKQMTPENRRALEALLAATPAPAAAAKAPTAKKAK